MRDQSVYWFGRFELRASERKLLRQGMVVDIGDRAFDVLVALVVRRGQVVTKSQLLDLVWPDVVVEESNVQVQVSALRKCLGPDFIATIQGRGYRFVAPVEGAAPETLDSGAVRVAGNLPAGRSVLVGRGEELRSVCAMVEAHPLVTLTGSGGMGKTVLSLAAAAQLSERFRDGAWVVELAPLSDSRLLAQAVAHGLRMTLRGEGTPAEQLVSALATRSLLLLLDNCEHLVTAVAELVDAIRAQAPGVHVLTTSQELLNLPAERVFRLGPLSVPAPGESPHPETHSAVALLVERAQAVNPHFAINGDNASAVADICRQLDGLPLALELAAARVHAIGPFGLQKKLAERFTILTRGARNAAPKHQTLYAAVDWSHELLEADERALFRRVAVFVGGFDLDACEAVCNSVSGARLDIVEGLGRLVDKSLVVAEPAPLGTVRYRLLETIRHYALDKLEAVGETRIMAHAHLRHYTAVAEEAYQGRFEADAEWLDLLERELDNVRAALEWAAENDRDAELSLAGALGWFWSLHTAHAAEGRMRLARALLDREEEQTAAVARTLTGAAMTSTWAGAPTEAAALGARSVAIWERLGDDREAGLANEALGWARFTAGDTAGALPPMERSAFLMRRLGDRRLMNRALIGQGQVLVALAEVEATERLAHEILNAGRDLGILRDIHYALHFLGDCGLWRGDGVDAAKWYRQSLPAALAYGNVAEAAVEMVVLAMALGAQGHAEAAVRLFGAASAKLADVHFDISGIEMARVFTERFIAPARAELGERADAVEAQGRSLSWAAAVAEALDGPPSPPLF
jgi:predicted ATPase/DNA-binding winged helix-turn-helix (wHTH) protein